MPFYTDTESNDDIEESSFGKIITFCIPFSHEEMSLNVLFTLLHSQFKFL